MARKRMSTVLTGSELNGGDQSIAEWVGLEVPEHKWDEYVELVGGVDPLSQFFETIKNGYFEVVDEEDDMGPGMNDTYWEVTTSNVEALRAEIRARLVKELGLQPEKPSRKAKPIAAKSKTRKPKKR